MTQVTIHLCLKNYLKFISQDNRQCSAKIGRKSPKIGEYRRKSQKIAEIAENRWKLPKIAEIAENWRKSAKVAENRRNRQKSPKIVFITLTPDSLQGRSKPEVQIRIFFRRDPQQQADHGVPPGIDSLWSQSYDFWFDNYNTD
jgi:hypothetical protein